MDLNTLFGATCHKISFNGFAAIPEINTEEKAKELLERQYDLTIDFNVLSAKPIESKALYAKGDANTSGFNIKLLFNNSAIDLTGYTVTANIQEGSNNPVTIAAKVIDINSGLISVSIPQSLVDSASSNLIAIRLQKGEKVLMSSPYAFTVIDTVTDGEIGTEEQHTALQAVIKQLEDKIKAVDNITNDLVVKDSDIDDIINMVSKKI